MTRHYSALAVLKEGLAGQKGWQKAWEIPDPLPRYDLVIIGGGGHGLVTAYYLARNHGIRNVAVIEKGWRAAATRGATPRCSAPTTSSRKVCGFMTLRFGFTKG